ncbi:MAG: hypothetical protein JSV76_00765 [Candidatus Bathyarchaeota archaeon]|nr:MAG: hypothetical protein JSV76_00765 [Candidatus Bathyarchaeota archaeon]
MNCDKKCRYKKKLIAVCLVGILLICQRNAFGGGINSSFYEYANNYFRNMEDVSNTSHLKEIIMQEALEGKFTGPANSMKINQIWAAERGVVYLSMLERYPRLFSDKEKALIEKWFEELTKRAFTREWSDVYYMITFRKPLTAPYRNQENGVAALCIYAEIIKNSNPDLASKAKKYVRDNAILWRSNFRNTDDSTSYQALWIYNAWNVGKLMFPESLRNTYSKQSFEWLMKQWPPNGGPLGYNPDVSTILPDIFLLGSHLHYSAELRWVAEKSIDFADKNEIKLSGFRPGLQFVEEKIEGKKPSFDSTYIEAPGNLVQFPSENRPDKIVFRSGWEEDSLYALLNLRYDGFHGYKATNSIVTLHYGVPFIVEDLVKISRKWLPAGRARVRDDNIERYRLNGFYIEEPLLNRLFNKLDVFRTRWGQTLPKHTKSNKFYKSDIFDYSKTEIVDWINWNNSRTCMLVKNKYFAVFDFNRGLKKRKHSIMWHLRGKYNNNKTFLTLEDYKLQTVFLFDVDSKISIKSSNEIHQPQSVRYEPNYDIDISSYNNHSEVISIFAPIRLDTVEVKPLKISEDVICVKIVYENNSDYILVNNSEKYIECEGMRTKANLLLLHKDQVYEMN